MVFLGIFLFGLPAIAQAADDRNNFVIKGGVQNKYNLNEVLSGLRMKMIVRKRSGESRRFRITTNVRDGIGWYEKVIPKTYKGQEVLFEIETPTYKFAVLPGLIELVDITDYEEWIFVRYTAEHEKYGLGEAKQTFRKHDSSPKNIREAMLDIARLNDRLPRFETLHLQALLLVKLLKVGGKATHDDLSAVFYLEDINAFQEMPKKRQFRIFNDLAIAFRSMSDLTAEIEPGMTYYDSSILFADKALRLVSSGQDQGVSHKYIAQLYQMKYQLQLQMFDNIECRKTIIQYLTKYGSISNGVTVRSFFGAWLEILETFSKRAEPETTKEYIDRLKNDKNIKSLWRRYYDLAQKEHLNRHWTDNRFSRLKKAAIFAQKISTGLGGR